MEERNTQEKKNVNKILWDSAIDSMKDNIPENAGEKEVIETDNGLDP